MRINFHAECKAYFCMNDFRSHREKLFNEMDEILENHLDFQDKIMGAMKSNDFCSSILLQIDE